MIPAQTLGALAGVRERIVQLVETLPARDVHRVFHPRLPTAGWLLGRAVYLETHCLRGLLFDDHDLSARVRRFFAHDVEPDDALFSRLPPQDHLLNWAMECFDHHLTLLANPRFLPRHPLLENGWLPAWLAQQHALLYERLLAVHLARGLARETPHRVERPLEPRLPREDSLRIDQGHYRIGARDTETSLGAERPAQVVELHAFRIQRRPVSNAEYLAFMEDGGYETARWWSETGEQWRRATPRKAPWHWRRDTEGRWYGEGIGGPADLPPDDPVTGIGFHEAEAFARWAAERGEGLTGAVLAHEFQHETAARLGGIETGRAREWCSGGFAAYDGHAPATDPELETPAPDPGLAVLRGASLHDQPTLRRPSFRVGARPDDPTRFAGLRLVLPPGPAFWEAVS